MTEKLEREAAIRLHRAMWNWIADVIEGKQCVQRIDVLKQKFVQRVVRWDEHVLCGCFCCEFVQQNDRYDDCLLCPLDWGTDHENDYPCERDDGLWIQCRDCTNWKEQAALARKIANLPERKVNKDDVL